MKKRICQIGLFFLLLIPVLMGGCLVIGSRLSFQEIQNILNQYAIDGSADFLSQTIYAKVVFFLGVLGVLLMLLGITLFIIRNRVLALIHDLLDSFRLLGEDVRKAVKAWKTEQTLHRLLFLLLIFVTVVLRITLISDPIRSDEASTFTNYASKPILQAISDYSSPNNHLLNTVLIHFGVRFFGNEVWVIRLPAFIAGILIGPLAYIVARIFYNKHVAILTFAFISVSSYLIEYSVNARGYSLVCAFFLVLIILAEGLKRNRSQGLWLLFVIFSTLGFATIPIMLYGYGIVVMWILLSFIRNREFHRIIEVFTTLMITAIATILIYLPAILVTGLDSVIGNPYVSALNWQEFITRLPRSISDLWLQWNRDIPLYLAYLFTVTASTAALFHRRLGFRHPLLLISIILWLVPVLLLQRVVPFIRVWIFLLPIFYVFAAAGIVFLIRILSERNTLDLSKATAFIAAMFLIWLGLSHWMGRSSYLPADSFRDAEAATLFLADNLRSGDRVMSAVPSGAPLEYYFDKNGLPLKYHFVEWRRSSRVLVVVNTERQNLVHVLQWNSKWYDFPPEEFSNPTLLAEVDSVEIYELWLLQ